MKTAFCLCLATSIIAAADAPAHADTVDPAAYPELSADALLPPILAELRRTLKDPHSITDFTLCLPHKARLRDGHPVSWSVTFSLNARNSYGGYEGVHIYSALFHDGHLSGPIMSDQFDSNEGFEGLINGMISRQMATCPVIDDARIQAILSGSIFKPG